MEEKNLFISSCTRRQLARRRPNRAMHQAQLVLAVLVIAAALGVLLASRGGL